jgi:hypothetical protein
VRGSIPTTWIIFKGDEIMGNIIEEFQDEELIVFDQEEATKFIEDETGIDQETIRKVLTAELNYMVKIGLYVMTPEAEAVESEEA